ncbi:MAG: hypothetical protein H6832_16210 [Planctomycetes bacterium]|nr:hypothetical protein [Planctomycetota bacterium]
MRPRAGSHDVGIEDRIVTKTDARGRFEVAALDNFTYSAVATWTDAAGIPRQSNVESPCTTDSLVRLVASGRRAGGVIDAVIDAKNAATAIRGTLRATFLAYDAFNPAVLATREVTSGRVDAIAIPWSNSTIVLAELRDDGGMIARDWIPLNGETHATWKRAIEVADTWKLRILDSGGKPVRGASVLQLVQLAGTWREVATSDSDGLVDAPLIKIHDIGEVVAIRSRGHVEQYLFRTSLGDVWLHAAEHPFANAERHDIRLAPANMHRGAIACSDSDDAIGLPIVLSRTLDIEAEGSKMQFARIEEVVQTDECGRFELPAVGPSRHCRLRVLITPKLGTNLATKLAHPSTNVVELGTWPSDVELASAKLDFEVATWRGTDLEVRSAEGEPVRGAAIGSLGALAADFDAAMKTASRSDRLGRCSLMRAGDSTPLFVFAEAIGWGLVPAAAHGHRVIELTPFAKKTLRIVDRSGEPVPGVDTIPVEWAFDLQMDRSVQRVVRALLVRGFRQRSDSKGELTLWWIDALRPLDGRVTVTVPGGDATSFTFKSLLTTEGTFEVVR